MAKRRRKREKLLNKKDREIRRRTQQILGIPTSATDRKGFEAEEKAERALNWFKERKTAFWGGRVIKSFESTMHYSPEDKEGRDFIVTLVTLDEKGKEKEKIELPIQVKSQWTLELQASYGRRGICFIGIWPNENGEAARERVAVALSNFLRIKDEREKKVKANKWQRFWFKVGRFISEKILRRKPARPIIEELKCKKCHRLYYTVSTPGLVCPNPICGAEVIPQKKKGDRHERKTV